MGGERHPRRLPPRAAGSVGREVRPLRRLKKRGGTGMPAQVALTEAMASAADTRPLATSCKVLVRKSCASPDSGGFFARAKPAVSAGQ